MNLNFISDVNECENNNGGCAQQCVNIEGSFFCQCNPGFVLEMNQRRCQGKYPFHQTRYGLSVLGF